MFLIEEVNANDISETYIESFFVSNDFDSMESFWKMVAITRDYWILWMRF